MALKQTSDWISVVTPTVLLVGENPTLQWSDETIPYVMFMDYYFDPKPTDLGERSRWSEAKNLFDYVSTLTAGRCRPEQLFGTDLWLGPVERPPKGKHLFLPEKEARAGMQHLRNILRDNPTIQQVLIQGMQPNYLLQKLGFYASDEAYLRGAQPRTKGVTNDPPYYQPVDGKVFSLICGKRFAIAGSEAQAIPILPARSFPLSDQAFEEHGEAYRQLWDYFNQL